MNYERQQSAEADSRQSTGDGQTGAAATTGFRRGQTTEQLQREVLLLQKKQLEKEAQAKPVTFGTIVGATLVAWIIIGVVGGIVAAIGFSFMMYDIQEQRDQEQLEQSLYSYYDSKYSDDSDSYDY